VAALKFRTFKIGSPRKRGEGIRIGTVRYTPHGIRKEDYACRDCFDVWLSMLAPSQKLLAWARERGLEKVWETFSKRYEREMLSQTESRQTLQLLALIAQKTAITVGCYCEDETRCHRSVLRKLIEQVSRGEM